MPTLKSLTFTSLPERRHAPVVHRRAKLASDLANQKRLLENPAYVRVVR